MTVLKPRNGVFRCTSCGRNPDPGEQVKAGKRHDCSSWYDGKWKFDKTTVIGPQKEVELTGNPLADALAILKLDGWVKGSFICDQGKKCVAGAVRAACGLYPNPGEEDEDYAKPYIDKKWYQDGQVKAAKALYALAVVLDGDEEPPRSWDQMRECHVVDVIAEFNDGSDTTRNQVVKALEQAAAEWSPRKLVPANLLPSK